MNVHVFQTKGREVKPITFAEFTSLFRDNKEAQKRWNIGRQKVLNNKVQLYKSAKYYRMVSTNGICFYFGNGLTLAYMQEMLNNPPKREKDLGETINTNFVVDKEQFYPKYNYFIKERYPVELLEKGPIGEYVIKYIDVKKKFITIDGDPIKITSDRLRLFKTKGTICVKCGLKGQFLCKVRGANETAYHLDLFGMKDGELVLFSKDHIQPLSKGGADHLSNLQTMCQPCNADKGNVVNVHDKINGISRDELVRAKLSAIMKIVGKNKYSEMSKIELCDAILKIGSSQRADTIQKPSLLNRIGSLFSR